MRRRACWLWLLTVSATSLRAASPAAVGEVNTLWVIPELGRSWVEPLLARRLPGGGLFNLQGFVAERDLGASVRDALAFLEGHPQLCPGFAEQWRHHDLYLAWPDEDQPRGGPSAGVAFAVAAYSALVGRPVRRDVVFTGAVDRDGRVLGVGGVTAKLHAALAAGMRTLCLPADGAPGAESVSLQTALRLRVVTLERADQAFFEAFGLDGPEVDRYDRLLTLYHDALEAIAQRHPIDARLALDELIELVPNDLSAQRLRLPYAQVDMREVALDLFADAAKYERDGLPDEALKAARRARSYADDAGREAHREVWQRLERVNLAPTSLAALEQAESLARRGALGDAWRTLDELRLTLPDQPYLAAMAEDWTAYRDVARAEDALRAEPDVPERHAALAEAYLAAHQPEQAARLYAALRRSEPDNPQWAMDEAQVRFLSGQTGVATDLLREVRPRWPAETDATCRRLGVELDPPALTVSPLELAAGRAVARIEAVDQSGPAEVVVEVDGTAAARSDLAPLRLSLDLAFLAPGEHEVRVAAGDRYGNQAAETRRLTVPEGDRGPCLRRGAAETQPDGAAAWLLAPASGTVLAAAAAVVVAVAEVPAEATVTLLIDGWPLRSGPGAAALVLRPEELTPGGHELQAEVHGGDGPDLLTSACPLVAPAEAATEAGSDELPGDEPLAVRTGTAALSAAADEVHPALRPVRETPVARLTPLLLGYETGPRPPPTITALRLDDGPLPPGRLVVGVGDALAFATPPPAASLGPAPTLAVGPLVTTVWTPTEPGGYRLPLARGEVDLEVAATAPLRLASPPSGCFVWGPTRVRLVAAAGAATVTLLDGDLALGTWPAPVPELVLDPAKLSGAVHLLRAVAVTAGGDRWLSPPVLLRTAAEE